MKHVYVSPHLDDAVLSCGGALHRHATHGESVLVVTIFAGDPEPGADLSPFALLQHEYWGNPPRPMFLRRAEDAAALALLDAESLYLDYLDAVYRTGPEGQWLYTAENRLWAEIDPADPVGQDDARELAEQLGDLIPSGDRLVIYAPLAVGRHIDHQIVHHASRRLLALGYDLAFYEDYPYAERQDALQAALVATEAEHWSMEILALDTQDLAAKVAALEYYRSQLPSLFGSTSALPTRVWSFAATRSPQTNLAERIWWPRKT